VTFFLAAKMILKFNVSIFFLFSQTHLVSSIGNNFVNKDGQKISFGRIHQNVGLVE
jgi:hypothetical protein